MMDWTSVYALRRLLVFLGDDSFRAAKIAGTCRVVNGQYRFRKYKHCIFALHKHVCCRDEKSPKGGYSGVVTEYHQGGEWTIKIDAGECVDGHMQTGEDEFQVELTEAADTDFVYLIVDEF